jgi:hypothetical protein
VRSGSSIEKMSKKAAAGRGGSKRKACDEQDDQSPPSKLGKTEASIEDGWRRFKCSERDLLWLVAEGILQEKSMVEWRPANKDDSPFELTGETVLFTHFAKRGLALPPSDFFRGLLHSYKLKLFHQNVNSIHISIFIHIYEAFPGI